MAFFIKSDQEWQTQLEGCQLNKKSAVAIFYDRDATQSDLQSVSDVASLFASSVLTFFLAIEDVPESAKQENILQKTQLRGYHPNGSVYGLQVNDFEFTDDIKALYNSVVDQKKVDCMRKGVVTLISNDAEWESFFAQLQTPCIVQFSAQWCGPCKRMYAIVDQHAANFADSCAFARVDIDGALATASKYRVSSVPNFMALEPGTGASLGGFVGAKAAELLQLVQNVSIAKTE